MYILFRLTYTSCIYTLPHLQDHSKTSTIIIVSQIFTSEILCRFGR